MNNDLISREVLKKDIDFQYICKCCHNVNGNVCDICPISEIEKKIDNAPTVEPETKVVVNVTFNKEQMEELVEKAKADILAQIERPQGEWIEGTQGYYCSECETIDRFYFEHNFCPNCGASMKKGGAE